MNSILSSHLYDNRNFYKVYPNTVRFRLRLNSGNLYWTLRLFTVEMQTNYDSRLSMQALRGSWDELPKGSIDIQSPGFWGMTSSQLAEQASLHASWKPVAVSAVTMPEPRTASIVVCRLSSSQPGKTCRLSINFPRQAAAPPCLPSNSPVHSGEVVPPPIFSGPAIRESSVYSPTIALKGHLFNEPHHTQLYKAEVRVWFVLYALKVTRLKYPVSQGHIEFYLMSYSWCTHATLGGTKLRKA